MKPGRGEWGIGEGRGGLTKAKLADDAADVGGGLEDALEAGGELLAAVEAVLQHGGHGLMGGDKGTGQRRGQARRLTLMMKRS